MCNNCINELLQAERDELRLQVSALTEALETQKRENQPYIKELERQITLAKSLLIRSKDMLWPKFRPLCSEIKLLLSSSKPPISPDWIPVDERLPDEDAGCVSIIYQEPFFGTMNFERGSAIYDPASETWHSPLTGGAMINILVHRVTHWQPMPPIPNCILNATGGDKPEQE